MAIEKRFLPAVKALVSDIVQGNFDSLAKDGRIGRLTVEELAGAISEYGRTLTEIPEEMLNLARSYPLEGQTATWAIDLPLWTREEGRSDLTLSFTLREVNGDVLIELDDLHVL